MADTLSSFLEPVWSTAVMLDVAFLRLLAATTSERTMELSDGADDTVSSFGCLLAVAISLSAGLAIPCTTNLDRCCASGASLMCALFQRVPMRRANHLRYTDAVEDGGAECCTYCCCCCCRSSTDPWEDPFLRHFRSVNRSGFANIYENVRLAPAVP